MAVRGVSHSTEHLASTPRRGPSRPPARRCLLLQGLAHGLAFPRSAFAAGLICRPAARGPLPLRPVPFSVSGFRNRTLSLRSQTNACRSSPSPWEKRTPRVAPTAFCWSGRGRVFLCSCFCARQLNVGEDDGRFVWLALLGQGRTRSSQDALDGLVGPTGYLSMRPSTPRTPEIMPDTTTQCWSRSSLAGAS